MPEKGWFVFDQAGLDAGACPEETSTDPVGDGWAVSADTLEELAKVIEVPEDELLKTVKQWNEFVDKGEDLAFYRPSDTLTGLNQPPYYAMLCSLHCSIPMAVRFATKRARFSTVRAGYSGIVFCR